MINGRRQYVCEPSEFSWEVNGKFSVDTPTAPLGYSVYSEIIVPAGQGIAGLSWWWEQADGAVLSLVHPSEGPDFVLPLKPVAELGTSAGGQDTWRCWLVIAPSVTNAVLPGNYHFRVSVTDGATTKRDQCRLYNVAQPGYIPDWNNVGYVPPYMSTATIVAQSPTMSL